MRLSVLRVSKGSAAPQLYNSGSAGGSHSWAQNGFGAAGSGSYNSMFVDGHDWPGRTEESPPNDQSSTGEDGPWPHNDRQSTYTYESQCYMVSEDSQASSGPPFSEPPSGGLWWAENLRRAAFSPPPPPKAANDRDTYQLQEAIDAKAK